jgi:hypothetical protein
MSTGLTVGIIIVVVLVLALVGFYAWTQMRSRQLRERFGPEYDRAVNGDAGRRVGERMLLERQKRYNSLDIKPLAPEARERYTQQWAGIQEQFVDRPGDAVAEADKLVSTVMADRGYPTDGTHEQRLADLSVDHSSTLDHYRSAHDVMSRHAKTSEASTEELREAMIHYRALFQDLLQVKNPEADTTRSHDVKVSNRDDETADPTAADPAVPQTPAEAEKSDGANGNGHSKFGNLTARLTGDRDGETRPTETETPAEARAEARADERLERR